MFVAPARERGLKLSIRYLVIIKHCCRSRKGAWIEIRNADYKNLGLSGRSRKGAWIEITYHYYKLAVRYRSLPQGSVD